MSSGVVYVAYGGPARREAAESIRSLRAHSALPVTVVSDAPLKGADHVHAPDADRGARLAKLSLDTLSPYELTCYLDADTRVRDDLSAGFAILADGWDVVLCASQLQGADVLGNTDADDRALTFERLGTTALLGLQAGLLWFRRSEAVHHLFAAWRMEWERFRSMDQAALVRALARVPVRVWLLGSAYQGADGEAVQHRFGRARR